MDSHTINGNVTRGPRSQVDGAIGSRAHILDRGDIARQRGDLNIAVRRGDAERRRHRILSGHTADGQSLIVAETKVRSCAGDVGR